MSIEEQDFILGAGIFRDYRQNNDKDWLVWIAAIK